jgi:hypothetical protein
MIITSGRYYRLLMGGWDSTLTVTQNATAIDASLESAEAQGALKVLFQTALAAERLIESEYVRTILFSCSRALALMLESSVSLNAINNNANALAQINLLVNASGYFIKRTATTTSSTFTIPAGGLEALYLLACGIGGAGGNAINGTSASGGSGAETKGVLVPKNLLPTSNTAYTVSSTVGTPTTFGSLLSAASGATGSTSSGNNTGGGSTLYGGSAAGLLTTDVDNAFFHIKSFSQQGAYGGARNGNAAGSAGQNGITGAGGAGGNNSPAVGGSAGTGICSGGGAGGDNGFNGTNPAAGANAISSSYGSGGGGGACYNDAASNGGTGGPSKLWIYYVEGRP